MILDSYFALNNNDWTLGFERLNGFENVCREATC